MRTCARNENRHGAIVQNIRAWRTRQKDDEGERDRGELDGDDDGERRR
jgi:hypothetical protein